MNTDEIKVLKFLITELSREINERLNALSLEYDNIEKPIGDSDYKEFLELFGHILSSYKVDFENIIDSILKNIEIDNFNINLTGIEPSTFYRKGRAVVAIMKTLVGETALKVSLNGLISKFEDIDCFYYSNAEIIQNYARQEFNS
ncbi:MAG: hypothetical protein MUE81_07860 [Thermoflexibacter sp.]|jgi:hypothetical protein|nr:hypothetical protein [Thermoflexibacter sp.]